MDRREWQVTEVIEPKIFTGEGEMVRGVMEQYVAWLNGWAENEPGSTDWRYTLADFSSEKVMVKRGEGEDGEGGEEEEHGGYGGVSILTKVGLPDDEVWLWVLRVYDGDEGGPAQLTVWWEEVSDAVYDKDYADIEYVAHWTDEDDYAARERKGYHYEWKRGIKIDGVDMAGVRTEAPKYLGDKHLGWRIGSIVQTFDLSRTFVYDTGKLVKGWET
jgi:hypothetical protein